jgi:hypothetical protein
MLSGLGRHNFYQPSKKFPEDELHDLLPDGQHTARFDDLRACHGFLKRKVKGQKGGQISFLRV